MTIAFGFNPGHLMEFDYVNWKGEPGHRRVRVVSFWFGSTSFHPEPQWLMDALDLEKGEHRTFAMRDMTNVEVKA